MDFWETTKADVVIAKKITKSKYNECVGCVESWFKLMDCDIFPQIADKMSLYMLLYRYVTRSKGPRDKANLYSNYYKKGILASCVPATTLAERTGKSERTIYRQIKNLETLGIVKVGKLAAASSWDKQLHNVYILGTHNFSGETYFIDSVNKNKPNTNLLNTVSPETEKIIHKVQVIPQNRDRHIYRVE